MNEFYFMIKMNKIEKYDFMRTLEMIDRCKKTQYLYLLYGDPNYIINILKKKFKNDLIKSNIMELIRTKLYCSDIYIKNPKIVLLSEKDIEKICNANEQIKRILNGDGIMCRLKNKIEKIYPQFTIMLAMNHIPSNLIESYNDKLKIFDMSN